MKSILLLLSLLGLVSMNAQDTPIDWDRLVGGVGTENPRSLQETQDGGCVVAGRSFSPASGDKSEDNVGEDDIWVVKFDSSGNIEWENTIGGISGDEATAIRQLSDGGYIIAGDSISSASGDKSESSVLYDVWVIRLNQQGEVLWENTVNADNMERTPSLVTTTDDGFVVGVTSNSNAGLDKTENRQGGDDYWILKFTSQGEIEWQNTIGGSGADRLTSLDRTADGGYILGGYSDSPVSGDKTSPSVGSLDYWIVKLNVNGQVIWDQTIGGESSDILNSVYQTLDNGFILGGISNSNISGDKTENALGEFDYWIVKTDETGDVQWENTIGGSLLDDEGFTIPLQSGDYLVTGYSNSPVSGDKTEDVVGGSLSLWLVQLSENGNIVGQDAIGGTDAATLNFRTDIAPYPNDIFIHASSSASVPGGDITDTGNGTNDFWVAKLGAELSVENVSVHENFINIYPNPASHFVAFDHGVLRIHEMVIYGMDGKSLKHKQFQGIVEDQIDISMLEAGLYKIYFKTDKGQIVKSLIKK